MRFAMPSAVTVDAVGSYPTHAYAWATPCQVPPFHPYLPSSFKKDFVALRRQSQGRRYLSVALSVALGRLATACCARPLAGILLYGARTFLHELALTATAWRTSGADFTACRHTAPDYLSCAAGAGLVRPASWVNLSVPPLSSNTPTSVPGCSGFSSNCCNWQPSVSAMYQRLP